MATTKRAEALTKKVPTRTAKTGVTWKNKTIDEFTVSEGHHWIAQLSQSSDGRQYRSIKQVITKRDGTQHFINGMSFKNEPTGAEIKGMIGLLLAVMPKTAKLGSVLKAVKAAQAEREA